MHACQDMDLHSSVPNARHEFATSPTDLDPSTEQEPLTPTLSPKPFDHHYYTLSFVNASQVKSSASIGSALEKSAKVPFPNALDLHPEFNYLHGLATSQSKESSPNSNATPVFERYYNLKIDCPCEQVSPQSPGELSSNRSSNYKLHDIFPKQYKWLDDRTEKETSSARENVAHFEDEEEWNRFHTEATHWLSRLLMTWQLQNHKQKGGREPLSPTYFDFESLNSDSPGFLPFSSSTQDLQVASVVMCMLDGA